MGEGLRPDANHYDFDDLHPIFALLRGDSFIGILSQFPTVERAMDFLYRLNNTEPVENVWQNPKLGKADDRVVAFLSHIYNEQEHWAGLFGMLKASGFENKTEARAAAHSCIGKMTDGERALDARECEEIGKVADSALDEVYR